MGRPDAVAGPRIIRRILRLTDCFHGILVHGGSASSRAVAVNLVPRIEEGSGLKGASNAFRGRYLRVGVVVAAGVFMLPVGTGRDALYCLVAGSGAVAMVVGVRRNRPAEPLAWYLIAAGTASWILAGALDAWLLADAKASPADAFYLATYPLSCAGLLLFARSRGPERRPTALLDSSILTVGVGLLSWVFLIQPSLAATRGSVLDSLLTIAYPLGNVMVFGALLRLAKVPGEGWGMSRLVAALFGTLLALQALAKAMPWIPVIDVHPVLLDPTWLLPYVLAGAVALHPSMRELSGPRRARADSIHAGQLVGLAASLLIGPGILGGELIAGVPLHAGSVVVASTVLVLLFLVRITRLVRHVHDQATTDDLTGLPNRRALYGQA
ncbi:MAG: hypothetical protein QOE58_2906, partial [Actinomycetota bacterium]|nr:hypothetical protein [Actinomycetota bacterium]